MKVSVIVPVYNTEKYLEKCIRSLLDQTLEGVEIVAVNDGSTDGCRAILDRLGTEYSDRLQVFHKENGGQATARNLALAHCRGEYIGFLDSDDWVDRDMYRILYEKARETGADYVACGYRDTLVENGEEKVLRDYVASRPASETSDLFFGALVSPFLHLYRREVLLDHGIAFPEGVIYEDTAFYLNAIPYIKKIAVVEKALATRVRRKDSTMTLISSRKVEQIMPVLRSSIDFYRERGFLKPYSQELEYFCTRILLCSSMERIARVRSRKEGWRLVGKTLDFLSENFPDYRKNTYMQRGLMHVYMKSFCGVTAGIYYPLFRLKAKFERRYE